MCPIHSEPWPASPSPKLTGPDPWAVVLFRQLSDLLCRVQLSPTLSKAARPLGRKRKRPRSVGSVSLSTDSGAKIEQRGSWAVVRWFVQPLAVVRGAEKTSGARADRVIKSPAGSAIRGVFDATRGSWGTGMKVYVSDKYLGN